MIENYERAKQILETYHQEHLLSFYDELEEDQKEYLINQILTINFKQIFDLYEASKIDEVIPNNEIEPLEYTIKKQLSNQDLAFYKEIGRDIIAQNKCAVITLAGGQGSRLGCKGPKGMFELDITPKKSLFEICCDNLKYVHSKYNVYIPWYIMTSIYNDDATRNYFKEKDFFGYPREYVSFFKQGELPLIDTSGNLILEETYKIKEASNGNGDVFKSMISNDVLTDIKQQNIEWIFFSGIDNVTLDVIDPLLLGLTIAHNKLVASKTLFKENPNDPDWIFAKRNGKPAIINCSHLTDEMNEAKNENGNYLYREMNMLAHLFHISAIDRIANASLPYHRAFKKNPFVNEEGMKQVPEKPNTFKFETFIFDAFSLFDDMELLRVEEEDEFAPIKDFNGIHNPERAKELYISKYDLDIKSYNR